MIQNLEKTPLCNIRRSREQRFFEKKSAVRDFFAPCLAIQKKTALQQHSSIYVLGLYACTEKFFARKIVAFRKQVGFLMIFGRSNDFHKVFTDEKMTQSQFQRKLKFLF